MALTTAAIESAFRQARTIFAGAAVTVRFEGRELSGVRSSTEGSDRPGAMGSLDGVDGAVRLMVSEMGAVKPEAGSVIQIKEPSSTAWQSRRVVAARYDQMGGTVRLD